MSEAAPEIYELWGESVLGAWDNLEPDVKAAWHELAETVRRPKNEKYPCPVGECPGDNRYAPPGRGHTCTFEEWVGL